MKTQNLLTSGLVAISAGLLSFAHAEGIEGYIGVDHTVWDGDRDLDDSQGIDLGIGVPLAERWAVEGWYGRNSTESDVIDDDTDVDTFIVNGLYDLTSGNSFVPFVTFGASHQRFSPDQTDSEDDTSLNLGLGFKTPISSSNFVFRGDLIGLAGIDGDNNFDTMFRLSIGYLFGGSSKTSSQNSVAATEPAAATVAATEAPAEPKDSDRDGVTDDKDQCPNTAPTLKVDAQGCALSTSETLSINLNVNFANNSDVVQPEYMANIKKVADFMDNYPNTKVEIKGFTDSRGAAEYNRDLSDRRAKAVADVLINQYGVSASRVSAQGYGELDPIATNDTAEGRASNRRVVAEISTVVTKQLQK